MFTELDFEVKVFGKSFHSVTYISPVTIAVNDRWHVVKKDFSRYSTCSFKWCYKSVDYILSSFIKFVSKDGVSRIAQFIIKHLKGEVFSIAVGNFYVFLPINLSLNAWGCFISWISFSYGFRSKIVSDDIFIEVGISTYK